MANPESLKNGYKLYIDNGAITKYGNGYKVPCTLRKTGSWGSLGNYSTDWYITIDGTNHSGTLGSFSDSTSTIGTYTRTVPVTPGAAARTITVSGHWDSKHGSIGAGTASKTITLPRIPYPTPGVPSAPSVSSPASGGFTATWTKPSGTVQSYRVAYRVNGGSWVFVETTGTSYSKSGLTPGATVGVEIKAMNDDAASAYSDEGTAVLKASAPSAPGKPTLTVSEDGTVTATWAAPSSAGGKSISNYDVLYQVPSTASEVTASNVGTSRSYALPVKLPPGKSANVRVRAKNADATGALSAIATIARKPLSGGKVWNGTAFAEGTNKVWDGTTKVTAVTKVWNGTAWADAV